MNKYPKKSILHVFKKGFVELQNMCYEALYFNINRNIFIFANKTNSFLLFIIFISYSSVKYNFDRL